MTSACGLVPGLVLESADGSYLDASFIFYCYF